MLQWVEDESNQNTDFDRNFLRHTIVPELSHRWPHIQASAVRSAQLCFEQEQLLDELLEDKFASVKNSDASLNIEALLLLSTPIRNRLIRRWFGLFQLPMPSQKQLSLIHSEVILSAVDAKPKLVVGTHAVRRFQNALFMVEVKQEAPSWQSDLRIDGETKLPTGLGTVSLRKASHCEVGLLVQEPKFGDRVWVQFNPSGLTLHPENRSGSRKLKKLFQEYQIPPWNRSQIPILMYNNDVVAVGNLFVCKAFSGNTYRFHWLKEE
jgi:tRNA(Ile)-lysidine synthase